MIAVLLAKEGDKVRDFKVQLAHHLHGRKRTALPTPGFVDNIISSVVSLQLLSMRGGIVRLSSWGRQVRRYFVEKDGSLKSALQRVHADYMTVGRNRKPSPDVSFVIGTTIRQHPSVSFFLSVLEEMKEYQQRSSWEFPEIFDYLKEHYPWETMTYLIGEQKGVPASPSKLEIHHIRSHFLDDTVRQLVHARILGDESRPLQGTRKTGRADVVIELL